MARVKELSMLVDELDRCGEALTSIARSLRSMYGGTTDEPKPKPIPEPKPETEKPKLTIEDVRKVCAQKSLEGKTAEVRELLKKHGADRLSAVNPDEYETLLHEAEVL